MSKEQELKGMPEKDPLYRLCKEYVDHKEVIKGAKAMIESMQDQLFDAFCKDGRDTITVRGFTVKYRELQKISCREV